MLGRAADSREIQTDDGNALLNQRIDKPNGKLRMLAEITLRAVARLLDEARSKAHEHVFADKIEVNIGNLNVATMNVRHVENDADALAVLKRKFLAHDVEVGSDVPCKALAFIAFRDLAYLRSDGKRDIDKLHAKPS